MMNELPFEKLNRKCDPDLLDSMNHGQVSPLKTIIGQERAVRALRFGLGIKEKGFNIYVSGRPGTGRTTAIERFLEEAAAKEQPPSDWCYLNNFRENYHPRILQLSAGQAVQFQQDMEAFINSVAREIRNTFERIPGAYQHAFPMAESYLPRYMLHYIRMRGKFPYPVPWRLDKP